ncbi:CDP-diacylglycerol--glycerol-3-phosphate 3-phosphatidyltransferase [Oxalobacteraceae bacterium GrIS 1.11]
MSIYSLKPKFQQLLHPMLSGLVRWGVTPNQVTLLATGLSLAYGAALALWPGCGGLWLGLPFFLFLRMALNAIDGMLANATGQKTALGALLNEIGDQCSDLALGLPFALAPTISAPLLAGVVIGALLAEFAGVLALQVGSPRRFDGPMGKSDRACAFGILALMVWGGVAPPWPDAVLLLVLALSLWTVFNRLRRALRFSAPPTP